MNRSSDLGILLLEDLRGCSLFVNSAKNIVGDEIVVFSLLLRGMIWDSKYKGRQFSKKIIGDFLDNKNSDELLIIRYVCIDPLGDWNVYLIKNEKDQIYAVARWSYDRELSKSIPDFRDVIKQLYRKTESMVKV